MKVIDCEQGSPEWFKIREKRMTGSHAQAIAANGKGLDTYINQLMQEYYSTAERDDYKSKAMERGNELEASARFAYEAETGFLVSEVGFVLYGDYAGVSPDGLVGDDGLVEIKCLEDKAYFTYLMDGKIDTKYEWQMQMQMLVCERQWCDYVLYNPNFKTSLIIKRVERDNDKLKKIIVGINSGIEKITEIENKFNGVLA